jgi:SAM-dependent methyltransferase
MAHARLVDTRAALAEEWRARDPVEADGIAAFYRDSERLGDDLEAWHATPERQEWTRAIVAIATNNAVESVLDVGAGGGHDLAALSLYRPEARLLAVEPNDMLAAALAVPRVPTINGVVGTFDLVLLIDVLEHVPDPERLLLRVLEHVPQGGLLVEATATHDQSTPLHLPHLAGWMPDKTLEAAGMRPVEQLGRMVVWQRQSSATADMATAIVVAHREIAAPTVECLFELVGRGWPIAIHYGDALIDRARAKAASNWFRKEQTDVFLMIDDDIVFRTEDAERVVALAREKRSIACAAYPVGDGGHLASRAWPGERIEFGPDKEPREIRWPATGFMAVHRDVIEALTKATTLCYPGEPDAFWPMFQPYAFEGNYLSEDYAFGQRARELGFSTWLEPRAILIHLKIKGLSVLNMPGATARLGGDA